MQLGFVSAILPDLSLEEALGFASESSFDCVEVACWPKGQAERRYAGVTHIDVANLDATMVEQIKELLVRTGVSISALGYYPNPLAPDPGERQVYLNHLRAVIDAAQLLSLSTVTTFIGRDQHKSIEDNWPLFREVWPPLVRYAGERGVNIGIENCPMLFTQDEWPGGKNMAINPTVWHRMFEEIPDANFGLNYDPSHLIWQQMDEIQPIREFAGRLNHIHAKDARLDRYKLNEVGILAVPNDYHTPKLPGLGNVQWDAFFSALTDARYTGPVCIELEDRAYEGSVEDVMRGLRQAARYLRQFM